jgi:hypothetical protein
MFNESASFRSIHKCRRVMHKEVLDVGVILARIIGCVRKF